MHIKAAGWHDYDWIFIHQLFHVIEMRFYVIYSDDIL